MASGPPQPKPSANRVADQPSAGAAISFPPYSMDLLGGRLLRGAEPVQLRPKTWSVLRYLAERPGVLVSKRELMDAVWTNVAVTESVMSKSIGELRVALGDASKAPRFIETVQRRGFRFIASVASDVPTIGRLPTSIQSSSPPRADQRTSAGTHFVGRATELRTLDALLAKAHDGDRQLAFVTGSAGIGKTALVDAFLEHAIRESA